MKYISTRDAGAIPREFSFIDAVLEGLAPDGGLLVPQSIPKVSPEEITKWRKLDYQSLCFEVLRKFISDAEVSDAELKTMIGSAYTTFSTPEIAPIVTVGPVKVMELFHGPTYAFKDVALQLLGQLFDFALKKRGARMTILGATSGDTGSAAIAGVKGRSNIDCVILFPLGRTSHVQELQMTSNLDANIHCLAVRDSVFDDCQSIVKSCFGDDEFNQQMSLGAVNSITWARILAQVVYYVYASLRSSDTTANQRVTFVVPTGNFGNMLAGYYAKQMGLPIGQLVIASNTNDILPRFFKNGEYRITGAVVPTMSPSMDIAVSSNFERFLFDLFGRSGSTTKAKFDDLKTKKSFAVTPEELRTAQSHFVSYAVTEDETLETISSVHRTCDGYLLCPHSAVGFAAAVRYASAHPDATVVTLATAHIGKFTEQILTNLQQSSSAPAQFIKAVKESVPDRLRQLESATTRRVDIANDAEAVKTYIRECVYHKHP